MKPEDISVPGTTSLKLPSPRLLEACPVDERLLRFSNANLERAAQLKATDGIARAECLGGIRRDADRRAKEQMKQLFLKTGFEKVKFR